MSILDILFPRKFMSQGMAHVPSDSFYARLSRALYS